MWVSKSTSIIYKFMNLMVAEKLPSSIIFLVIALNLEGVKLIETDLNIHS